MDEETSKSSEFSYAITESDSVSIVTFAGPMNQKSVDYLHKCQEQLLVSKTKKVIFNFRDVKVFTSAAIPTFVQLQAELRKSAALRLCFLLPNIAQSLLRNGVIRNEEITKNMIQAMKAFK